MMDSLGNKLEKGDLVYFKGELTPIGKVVEIHDGGVRMRDGAISPQKVVIAFEFTIVAPHNVNYREIIKVADPTKQEETPKIATA